MRDLKTRFGVLGELMGFLWKRKLYWLMPMIIVLSLFAILVIVGGSGSIAPFIYAMF